MKGGETGVNGEWYEGGKFLPSTTQPKRKPRSYRATGRVEIEPGVWTERRDGFLPLYPMIAALCDWKAPTLRQVPESIVCFGDKADKIAAYVRGERWVAMP